MISRRAVAMVACLILLSALAGCLVTTTRTTDRRRGPAPLVPALHIRPGVCPDERIANCAEMGEDPTASYVVEDLRIRAGDPSDRDEEPNTGVLVEEIDRGVVLRNVEIRGLSRGLVVQNVTCATCRVALHDSTIDASGLGSATGVRVEGFHGTLEVAHVRILVPGGGEIVQVAPGFEGYLGGGDGIVLSSRTAGATVQLDDVTISAEFPNVGWGLEIGAFEESDGATLVASDVVVRGFHRGMWLQQMAGVDVSGALFRHNNVSLTSRIAEKVNLKNVTIRDSRIGAVIDVADGAVPASMQGLRITDNDRVGMYINRTEAEISGATVARNGHDWPSDRLAVEPDRFGGIVVQKGLNSPLVRQELFRVTIHDSSFEDNAPFALSNRGEPIDARHNWWGDERGPRVNATIGPAQTGTVGPGAGEVITEGIEYSPWRRSPPE